MKSEIKRYIMSSLLSFLAGIGIYLLANIDSITLESFKSGSILGTAFLALRAGLKLFLEYFIPALKDLIVSLKK